MTCNFTPDHQRHRLFAEVQRVLSVAALITILAVIPVQARPPGSTPGPRPHSSTTFAVSNRALTVGEDSTCRLMRLMDKDKNGIV
jgi:hypothetical protein